MNACVFDYPGRDRSRAGREVMLYKLCHDNAKDSSQDLGTRIREARVFQPVPGIGALRRVAGASHPKSEKKEERTQI